ncbi:hypothetical protein EVAR_59518_1 [Eumeta japonica]|uniref:Uncharacterized protein n=1 Tax=Eumeta variegata TaxID=151549 RepID=A0A4C1XSF3_EUMVA|nr:hypothetical protein EVAR_59518_1 [Eumeta japonica]
MIPFYSVSATLVLLHDSPLCRVVEIPHLVLPITNTLLLEPHSDGSRGCSTRGEERGTQNLRAKISIESRSEEAHREARGRRRPADGRRGRGGRWCER